MKLVIYFGVIIISLICSLIFLRFQIKKSKKYWMSFFMAFLVNVIILGIGSLWWFLTETDGISQGIGVLIYCISVGVIGLIDLILLTVFKSNIN